MERWACYVECQESVRKTGINLNFNPRSIRVGRVTRSASLNWIHDSRVFVSYQSRTKSITKELRSIGVQSLVNDGSIEAITVVFGMMADLCEPSGSALQGHLTKINENVAAGNVDQEIRPDPQFCLEEANIALVSSDNWAFCVHKSVLRRLSVVFRNMFEDCSPPKSLKQQDKFNDLDVIKISESHDIVRLFFSIIYDQKSVASIENYVMLGALVVFCNKYMIHSIIKRFAAFLKLKFPDSLADYKRQIRDPSSLKIPDIVHITRAALEANLKCRLVVGLYSLAVNRETTMEYLSQFSHGLLVHYSHGLSKLSGNKFRSDFKAKLHNIQLPIASSYSSTCSNRNYSSSKCEDSWRSFKDTNLAENPMSALTVLLRCMEDISPTGVCQPCGDTLKPTLQAIAQELWVALPAVFRIGNSWEELKKEEEERFKTDEE